MLEVITVAAPCEGSEEAMSSESVDNCEEFYFIIFIFTFISVVSVLRNCKRYQFAIMLLLIVVTSFKGPKSNPNLMCSH
jgi:hypothetical protein